jgi:hypothetical protein
LAAFTIGSQFVAWASVCSQTVMLLAACVPPEAVDATTARAAPTRTTAPMMRALKGDFQAHRRRAAHRIPVATGA